MNIKIEELNPKVINKKLGQNVYSSKGSLLLRYGAEIHPLHFSRFKELGYRSIYIQDGYGDAFESNNGHVIPEDLRAKAPFTLREIFQKLQSEDRTVVAKGKRELDELAESMIERVNYRENNPIKILDLKRENDYLYQHSINVAAYSILIGYSLKYHQLKLFDLTISALLHDFGLVDIKDQVLNKSTPLDAKDLELIKAHTLKGFQFLNRHCRIKGLVTVVALQHHERFDGSGYPKGIAGNDIHEYSRIVSLTHFFDAYTSDRPYRRLHTIEEALDYIKGEAGKAFDPQIVQVFLKFFE